MARFTVTRTKWGLPFDNRQAETITMLDTKTGIQVVVSDFGANIIKTQLPDKNGKIEDVNFGHNSPKDYFDFRGHFGGMVGRTCSRILNGTFKIDDKEYKLSLNDGIHHKHGGKVSFDKHWWQCKKAIANDKEAQVEFELISPEGDEGYPGQLVTRINYNLKPNELSWEINATSDKPTIVNITNHGYWNLDGLKPTVDGQELILYASQVAAADKENNPTGQIIPVKGTPVDFQKKKTFQQIFAEAGDIDHTFMLDGYAKKKNPKDLFLAAELYSPKTGRKMTIETTEPALIVYTGNSMDKLTAFGVQCLKHNAVCLETMRPPNAVNFPQFASMVILKPGQTYYHKTVHKFGLK